MVRDFKKATKATEQEFNASQKAALDELETKLKSEHSEALVELTDGKEAKCDK